MEGNGHIFDEGLMTW